MASEFTPINPKRIANAADGADAELIKIRAADSKTWEKGELAELASGLVQPLASTQGAAVIYGQFAEDQATSTSSSDVWVRVWPHQSQIELYVSNSTSDAAIGNANRGVRYDVIERSGVAYLDLNATTTKQFEVLRLAADYDSDRNLAADTPGKCVCVFHKV